MQYLSESDIVRPPHVMEQLDLSPLLSSGYTPGTIALLLQLPHLKSHSFEVAEHGTLAFPYLCLSDLNTLSGGNNPRDPLDHYEDLDWTIPPWTFFLTRPAPETEAIFANCRIYDTRSKALGLWSDSLSLKEGSGRFLIDARSPQQVFGEWIEALQSLKLVPSLSNGEENSIPYETKSSWINC